MAKFKTRQGLIIEDLKKYVSDWISDKPNIEIYIGCDSQERERHIDYAVSICMYDPGKGGHVINRITSTPLSKTINTRLWEEVNMSILVADELKDLNLKITIHCDYNSKPTELSNQLYDSGIGYAKAMGYEAAGKPNAWCSTYVADHAVRN